MRIGIPKEIKVHEYRVGMVPSCVSELTKRGHQVFVETQAGTGIGFSDQDYRDVGAEVVGSAGDVFSNGELIVKVKEPQPKECEMLDKNHTLFTYLHLAPDPKQAGLLMKSRCKAIAYETVTDEDGRLPLLQPMSEVAGRMSIQAGAHSLEKAQNGAGLLLGGVPGVAPATVLVLGGGVVGTNAIRMAVGIEANVVVLDKSSKRLRELNDMFGNRLTAIYSTEDALAHWVKQADLVVGAVLVAGGTAPKLVTKEMLCTMKDGSVLVDVSIDQGGCFETSQPTTHQEPTYVEGGVVHYCVTNMPGAVPRTATFALNNVTLPFILQLAELGTSEALTSDHHLLNGLNVCNGHITHDEVAAALSQKYVPALELL